MAESLKDNRTYYDEFSAGYDTGRDRGYHAMLDELETRAVREAGEGKIILEAGCGTGLVMQRVSAFAGAVYGVDLSGGMLSQAVKRGLPVAQGNLTAIPLRSQSVDVVYSFKVLAHVREIEKAVVEMARVVRPGGKMILEFYNPVSLRGLVKKLKPPSKVADTAHDEQVFTRFDTLRSVRGYLPAHCSVARVLGVRVWTPFAFAHKIPVVGSVLRWLERASFCSPLARWAGFLIVEVDVK